MSSEKTFEIELLKYLFLNTNYSPQKVDPRWPLARKISFKLRLKLGFLALLPIVERLLPNIKILVFSRNGILIKSLEEDFFVKFKYLYDRLLVQDREKYIKCLAYKLLGWWMVNLRMSEEYYQKAELAQSKCVKKDETKNNFCKEMFDLSDLGYPGLRLWLSAFGVMVIFMEQQYAYGDICRVEPGDFVIDAGGGYGDTALYFASLAGKNGMVYVFEFVPSSIDMMKNNFALNPDLNDNLHIIPNPLDERSDNQMFFKDAGLSSKIVLEQREGFQEIKTKSIDDLVLRHQIEKIDFIKMDIEGAELTALKGAKNSIRRFRPKLAICVYHKIEDFYEIPLFIDSLGVGYTFYFDYFTPVGWEIMLYCVPVQ